MVNNSDEFSHILVLINVSYARDIVLSRMDGAAYHNSDNASIFHYFPSTNTYFTLTSAEFCIWDWSPLGSQWHG
jgi:hypothetical protein